MDFHYHPCKKEVREPEDDSRVLSSTADCANLGLILFGFIFSVLYQLEQTRSKLQFISQK